MILDCALGRLGLLEWCRQVYFSFHAQVRLRFKLAEGLGSSSFRSGGILQGCPVSMVFSVALYVQWCRCLARTPGLGPQLDADNIKCSSYSPLDAASFTDLFVKAVGQEVFPSKCVLLSISKAGCWGGVHEDVGCIWWWWSLVGRVRCSGRVHVISRVQFLVQADPCSHQRCRSWRFASGVSS